MTVHNASQPKLHQKSDSRKYNIWLNFLVTLLATNLFSIFIAGHNNTNLNFIFMEDGPLENLSAVFYFSAAAIFAFGFKNKPAPLRFWCLFFAVLMFLVGGEEISWGQRIFGIVTPESLNAVNVQNEFNIHNIDGIHQYVRTVGVAFVGLFCFLIPISNRLSQKMSRIYTQLGVPVFPLSAVWLVALSIIFMIVPRVLSLGMLELFMLDEIGEFLLSFAWIPFALNNSLEFNLSQAKYDF
ncbi:hypothetical protein PGN35_018475 [Nodosilinea sp. PGN35]|uniref:hypothetical protein n=1 Tax=Nodosilinea sp. PGN35 TaxID=3020489 RepID=UPI0023B2134F|nr:hypothetical protein [Nodosilinea sp. TSF1-S3]MDF0368190.1 hypothetical protein [Nodosilinea sp. TSF1-S3]